MSRLHWWRIRWWWRVDFPDWIARHLPRRIQVAVLRHGCLLVNEEKLMTYVYDCTADEIGAAFSRRWTSE